MYKPSMYPWKKDLDFRDQQKQIDKIYTNTSKAYDSTASSRIGQGTCLGFLIHAIQTNDCKDWIKNLNILIYADDT